MDDDDWEVPIPQSKVAPTSTSDHDLLEDRGSLTSSVHMEATTLAAGQHARILSESLDTTEDGEAC